MAASLRGKLCAEADLTNVSLPSYPAIALGLTSKPSRLVEKERCGRFVADTAHSPLALALGC